MNPKSAPKGGILEVLQKLKSQLQARGAKCIRSLGSTFRRFESLRESDGMVDAKEFFTGLNKLGCSFTQDEANILRKFFDTNGDGYIDFNEFLVGIRGKPNAKRQALVDKCWLAFDKDGNNKINILDVKSLFNSKAHPKVQKKQMKEEDVFLEFLQNFGDADKDGTITKEEWDSYYAGVSSSIDNDDHFVELMKMSWKLE